MSLAHGRAYRAMPGPSIIPDRVLGAMHRAAPNIYHGELIEITETVRRDLKRVAATEGDVAMYIGNGHAAWEAALVNTLAPGDTALVLATGRFAPNWGRMATALGIEVDTIDFGDHAPVNPQRLEDRLRQDREGRIRAVLVVQTDTATSVNNDIAALGQAVRASGSDALFLVDCIASLGCERYEMDAWGADVTIAGCQKGLMTPPGMSFTFQNDRANAARARLDRVSPYFDWVPRRDPEIYYQNFCGTAPTHHLYGLRAALDMILEEGLENLYRRHEVLARLVWSAAEVWSETGAVRPNIADRAHRSVAVTTFRTGGRDGVRLQDWCEAEAGVTLGVGLALDAAMAKGEDLFRIGHMGHLNPHMIMGVLGVVDAGLKALGIAHGGGALRVASDCLADTMAQEVDRTAAQ